MRLIYHIKQAMLAGGDMLGFIIGFWISLTIRYWQMPSWQKIESHVTPFFLLFLIWLVINFINGLYDLNKLKTKNLPKQFIITATIAFVVGIIFFYFLPNKLVTPKTILLLSAILGYLLSYFWRLGYSRFIGLKRLHDNIIFIGYTPESQELISIIQNHPEGGHKVVALIDPENKVRPEELPFFDVYRSIQAIRPAISNHKATGVVIAPHLNKEENVLREIYSLLFWDVQIYDLPSFYEIITGRITPTVFSEAWFLENLKNRKNSIYDKLRRFVDLLVGILMLIVFLPIFPMVALITKLYSPGPIFFKQTRVGKGNRDFIMYKFRSMYEKEKNKNEEKEKWQLTAIGDRRVVHFWGNFLRKTRIDELPQCLNILKGDITLVGPRPTMKELVEQIRIGMPFYDLRHTVKPGLTGWAVIHQNYSHTVEDELKKLQYDLFYVKNKSFLLDLSIILRTINIVLRMMGQ